MTSSLLFEVEVSSAAVRRRFVAELHYVLTAYFSVKYPSPGDPRLTDPDAVPRPSRAARY